MLIFSVSREMDGEDKHAVCLETRLQVSESAWEYSDSTGSYIKHGETFPAVAADCEVSTDNTTRCMDDYNMLKCLKPAHEQRPDGTQADTDYNQQVGCIHDHMVKCFPCVKCEEHRQELSEQSHVLPFSSADQETSLACDANESILLQVKQEATEDPNVYDRHNEGTRHWIVCHGGVLKEVKSEHTTAEECNENGGRELSTHICTHHNNIHDEEMNVPLYTDSICGLSSTHDRRNDSVLKVSKRSCKGVKDFMCDTCGKKLVDLSQLNVHERTHGVTPFICGTCGKSFARPGHLTNHKRAHTSVKPFTCRTCGKSFTHSRHFKNHKRTHTSVKPFTCGTCGKSFVHSGHLENHKRIHTGVGTFTRDAYGNVHAHPITPTAHQITHTGVKPFTCDTCGKSFAHSNTLKVHERTHSGVNPFTCDTCGKSCAHSASLKVHKRIHTGEKPFTCDTCGKSFIQSRTRNVHERKHTGVKHFKCNTCRTSFARSSTLKKHEITHCQAGVEPITCDTRGQSYTANVEPFTCDTSGKSYIELDHLKRHELIHTLLNIRPYQWPIAN